jgi:hypothetical protein
MSAMSDRAEQHLGHLELEGRDVVHLALLRGLARGFLAPADELSRAAHGDAAAGPWQSLTDPRFASDAQLAYAAQWTGGTMPTPLPGETAAAYARRARLEVLRPRGILRGSPASLELVAQAYLTGSRTARVIEFYGGDAFAVGVRVRPSELGANEAALRAALNDPSVVFAGGFVDLVISESPLVQEGTRTLNASAATIDTATTGDVT